MIIKVCLKCNSDGEGRFCSKCGVRLATVNRCPKCGMDLGLGDDFCSNCGAKLDEPTSRIPKMRATIHP